MHRRGVSNRGVRWAVALVVLGLLAPARALAGPAVSGTERLALVIGNSAYVAVSELPNPKNDAADVGAALGRLGFDVTTLLNGDRAGMDEALQVFARRSVGADTALVFYAGHGMEVDGVNYLVPVDARLESDTDVEYETVNLDRVLRATEGATLRMVILDACRDNPLARSMRRVRATRSISRGAFGDLDEQQLLDETLVAYAAAAGTTAADGLGRNSPYTEALLTYLEQPLEISAMFRRVRGHVLQTTGGRQRPHEYQSLLGDHYLTGARGDLAQNPAVRPSPGGVGVGAVRSRPSGERQPLSSERQPPGAPRPLGAPRPSAGLPAVSVRMVASSTAELASGTDARLAGEVRAILRGRGLQVVDSVGGGRVPELHLEGAVELSDAGDVAGTGFMSSNAAASLQVVDTATGAVVAASRARARGAGISAGDARDRAGIRAVEEALAALVDDLIAVWPGR